MIRSFWYGKISGAMLNSQGVPIFDYLYIDCWIFVDHQTHSWWSVFFRQICGGSKMVSKHSLKQDEWWYFWKQNSTGSLLQNLTRNKSSIAAGTLEWMILSLGAASNQNNVTSRHVKWRFATVSFPNVFFSEEPWCGNVKTAPWHTSNVKNIGRRNA